MSTESLTFAVNRRESLTQNNFANKKPILLELEIVLLKKLVLEYQLFSQKGSAHLMGKMVRVLADPVLKERFKYLCHRIQS